MPHDVDMRGSASDGHIDPAREVRRSFPATVASELPAVAFGLFAFLMMLRRVAGDRIWSDEQIFLGGAGLMARGEGLIYRDFFYTHAPLLALLMSGLFRVISHWALAARLVDATCGAAVAALIFEAARRSLIGVPAALRLAGAAAVGVVFVFDPIVANACGVGWNHNFAALLCLTGFLLLAHGLGRARPAGWAIAAGASAAAAATSRLTYAPPMVAFPLLILLASGRPMAARWRLIGWWSAGALLAAVPSLVVIAQAPAAAWFDNVRYPGLTERFTTELKLNPRLGLWDKLDYCALQVRRSSALQCLIALTVAALAIGLRPRAAVRSLPQATFAACALLLAAALATALVPTPTYQQYLYAPIPFAALAIALSLGRLPIEWRRWAAVGLLPIALWCAIDGNRSFPRLRLLARPGEWAPNQWHAESRRLAARVDRPGKVLTLTPGLPLEAGLRIYPELSIGRYAARSAAYLTAEQRAKFHVPDEATMRGWFAHDPPAAVLLDVVDPAKRSTLETTIESLAAEHGYTAQAFGEKRTLWLRPGR